MLSKRKLLQDNRFFATNTKTTVKIKIQFLHRFKILKYLITKYVLKFVGKVKNIKALAGSNLITKRFVVNALRC